MTMLPDDVFAMLMQGHFSKHISTSHNCMTMLPNDLNSTSMQGRFCKHMAASPANYITK